MTRTSSNASPTRVSSSRPRRSPSPPTCPWSVSGSLAFVAGQVPIIDGQVLHPGLLGERRLGGAGLRGGPPRGAAGALGPAGRARSFDRLGASSQVTVYIASTPEFAEHPQVANGASELLVAVLGEEGKHARAAIGMASLPLGGCVEVAVTAEVAPS